MQISLNLVNTGTCLKANLITILFGRRRLLDLFNNPVHFVDLCSQVLVGHPVQVFSAHVGHKVWLFLKSLSYLSPYHVGSKGHLVEFLLGRGTGARAETLLLLLLVGAFRLARYLFKV